MKIFFYLPYRFATFWRNCRIVWLAGPNASTPHKTLARRVEMNEGSFFRYKSGRTEPKTFKVLALLNKAYATPMILVLGSNILEEGAIKAQSIRYSQTNTTRFFKQLGRAIKAARKTKGWTQRQLAAASGSAAGQINDIEHGNRSSKIATIHALFVVMEMRLLIYI